MEKKQLQIYTELTMGNHIEQAITPDFSPMVESNKWETHAKTVPQVASALTQVEELFGNYDLGQLFCDAAHEYDQAYLRWQTVRISRSGSVIGNSPLYTGFEGFYVGFMSDPEQIVNAQAALGQKLLDTDVRAHQYAQNRRHLIDRFIHDGKFPTLKIVAPLNHLFIEMTGSARLIAATSHDYEARAINAKFRETTTGMITGIPPLSLTHHGEQLVHVYCLPKIDQNPNIPPPTEQNISRNNLDGFHLVQSIGIIGHPVMRRILDNRVVMAKASSDRAYYPPKGSERRTRLDRIAQIDLINEIARVAPDTVEEYLNK